MEQTLYPPFLQQHAFYNLVPRTAWARFSVGLFFLWVALSVGFSFVFLDTRHRTRVWVGACSYQILLPMLPATYYLVSSMCCLDPLLALAHKTERSPGGFLVVQEKGIRTLQKQHALTTLAAEVLVCAALTIVFVLVPGHRL